MQPNYQVVEPLSTYPFAAVPENKITVRAVRDPFEAEMFGEQAKLEEEALAMFRKDPSSARKFLTSYSDKRMNQVTEMFLELRDQIITRYTNNRE